MLVGYARVSTTHQKTELQNQRLSEAGCERVFQERVSGKSTAGRQQLEECLAFVREGDHLVVTKLDRLARSLADLLSITLQLEEKGVDLVVLDQSIDTRTPAGRLMFQMVGAFAEFERALAEERRNEGIARAREKGVKFGRPRAINGKESEVLLRMSSEGAKLREMSEATGVTVPTISRWLKQQGVR